MTNDESLSGLQADWQRQSLDLAMMKKLTQRRRRLIYMALVARPVAAVILFLLAGWFAYRAIANDDLLDALAAIAMIGAIPIVAIEYFQTRREMSGGIGHTPRDVVIEGRKTAELSRRLLWGCRWNAAIFLACATAVLGFAAVGLVKSGEALALASIWSATALLIVFWEFWRIRKINAEIDRCDQLLSEFRAADED